jgi:transcriptional regulator with XRE-family HTH domain
MDLIEIGRLIAEARIKADMTQAELAATARVGKTTLSDLERGALSDIGFKRLCDIADAINLTLHIQERKRPTLNTLRSEAAVNRRSLAEELPSTAKTIKQKQKAESVTLAAGMRLQGTAASTELGRKRVRSRKTDGKK